MPTRETDSESTDLAVEPTETTDWLPSTSRRDVLGSAATAITGGALLTGVAGRVQATPHGGDDRPLDVRTTDVEVLDEDGVETAGTVEGMERVDTEKCRIGAQVRPAEHEQWYGGIHDVVTVRADVRVAVTLAGLSPGTYDCRVVACPVTHDHVCFGNTVRVDVNRGAAPNEKKERHEKERHEKTGEAKEKNGDHEGGEEKERRHEEDDDCPCELDHPGRRHLTFHADDWQVVRHYAFAVATDRVERSARSCGPDLDEYATAGRSDTIHGNVVTGAVVGGADSFLFPGEVTDLRCDDGVDVYLDGKPVQFRQ